MYIKAHSENNKKQLIWMFFFPKKKKLRNLVEDRT